MAVKGTKRREKTTRAIAEEPRVLDLAVVEEEQEVSPPAISPRVRIAAERDGVAIWSQALFNDPLTRNLRLFLSRVFSLREISVAEIDRRAGVGRLKYQLAEGCGAVVLAETQAGADAAHRGRSRRRSSKRIRRRPAGSRSAVPGYAGDFTDSHRPDRFVSVDLAFA